MHHMGRALAKQSITSSHHFLHGKDQFLSSVYYYAVTLQGLMLGLDVLIGLS